ncbi:hypothetical protein GCK32_007422 [Trichostrongylus colubriformis]|uniref:Uncharacterized protein n=1 Tax=Trichostrongylus colubriformis TaxID=6319 RepID=A0AAN8EXK6_TRICO
MSVIIVEKIGVSSIFPRSGSQEVVCGGRARRVPIHTNVLITGSRNALAGANYVNVCGGRKPNCFSHSSPVTESAVCAE